MATSYFLIFSDGTLDTTVLEDQVVDNNSSPAGHGLTFTGRGVTGYGEARNENILHLAENFAHDNGPGGTPSPTVIPNPVPGQMWYDVNAQALAVYNGATWDTVSSDNFVLDGTYSVNDGTGEILLTRNVGGPVIIDNVASQNNFTAHVGAGSAHDASAITFVPTGSVPGTNAQDAIEDLLTSGVGAGIEEHITDAIDAHDADAISFVPFGSVGSVEVQAAIEELDDEITDVNNDLSDTLTDLSDHIGDLVDAHDASAISFVPGASGLTSTDVQAAIDEIFASGGSPGALETTRVRPSSTQAIGTVFTQINFQIIDFGNASSQWNVGTSTYTAAFDQEVNITFGLAAEITNDRDGQMEIRVGATSIRNHQFNNFDNSSDASTVPIDYRGEITTKVRLTVGQQVTFWAVIDPPFNAIHDTQDLNISTFAEFEVVREL